MPPRELDQEIVLEAAGAYMRMLRRDASKKQKDGLYTSANVLFGHAARIEQALTSIEQRTARR